MVVMFKEGYEEADLDVGICTTHIHSTRTSKNSAVKEVHDLSNGKKAVKTVVGGLRVLLAIGRDL